jgi:hypothetical protein
MPSRPARPQLGLFDNPGGAFRLEELTETVRALERQQPGRTVDGLSRAVFAELGMKRTRRAVELVGEAIRLARARKPPVEIAGSRWQASTGEVRAWAVRAGFEPGSDGGIPEQAIMAYNQAHPERPY